MNECGNNQTKWRTCAKGSLIIFHTPEIQTAKPIALHSGLTCRWFAQNATTLSFVNLSNLSENNDLLFHLSCPTTFQSFIYFGTPSHIIHSISLRSFEIRWLNFPPGALRWSSHAWSFWNNKRSNGSTGKGVLPDPVLHVICAGGSAGKFIMPGSTISILIFAWKYKGRWASVWFDDDPKNPKFSGEAAIMIFFISFRVKSCRDGGGRTRISTSWNYESPGGWKTKIKTYVGTAFITVQLARHASENGAGKPFFL